MPTTSPSASNTRLRKLAQQILTPENVPDQFLNYVTEFGVLNQSGITSGQVIGADLYNRQIDIVATQQDIVNTTTDTVIYTYVIGGGLMGTQSCFQLFLLCDYLNNSGAGRTWTLTVSYGGTTMFRGTTSSLVATANRGPILMQLFVSGAGSTQAQTFTGIAMLGDRGGGSASGIGNLTVAASNYFIGGTSAVNSAINQTFEVKFQHSTNNASLSFRRNYAVLTKIGH